jgi:hypothetical protein
MLLGQKRLLGLRNVSKALSMPTAPLFAGRVVYRR